MIVGCLNEINEVHYSGYTIDKIYACGGELVYTKDSSLFVKNHYKSGTTIIYEEFSCDQMVMWDGVLSCSVIKHYNTGASRCDGENNGVYIIDSEIGNCVTSIDSSAYRGCSQLSSVTFSNSVTSVGSQAFRGCTSLTSITLPNSVTSVGNSAFSGCTGLINITLPNSVTSVDSYAFAGCSNLRSIMVGSGVTSIGNYAFNKNTGHIRPLDSVTIYATTPPTLGTDVFRNDSYLNIYVPATSLTDYQTAWSDYASRIQPIT